MKRKLLQAGCLILLSGLGGYVSSAYGYAVRAQDGSKRASGPTDDQFRSSCAGGLTPELDLDVVPERTIAGPTGQRLVVNVVAKNARARSSSLAYALEVQDDLGKPVAATTRSSAISLSAAAEHRAAQTLPSGLADGYYLARATAAVKADGNDVSLLGILYFAVTKGEISIIDANEYYAKSRANQGVSP